MRMRGLKVLAGAAVACALVLPFARDARAVDAPRWVAAIYVDAQRAIGLRWNPVPGATGYKVLRSTTAGSGHAVVASPAQPQYFDLGVEAGTTYSYVLQAVVGAEASANSEEKSVTVPGTKAVAAVAPTWAKVVAQETTEFGKTSYRVGLSWNKIATAIAYNVYRSTTPGKDHQMLSSVSETQYTDATAELGKTYYYRLSALDGSFQESPLSAEEKVTIEKSKAAAKKSKIKLKIAPRPSTKVWSKMRGDENGEFNFFEPYDVEYDPGTGNLLAISNNTAEVYVLKAKTGALVTKFGTRGKDPGQFQNPLGMGLDADGNVVVADQERMVLIVSGQDGGLVREVVPTKLPPEYLAKFPKGPKTKEVAVDKKTGDYYVADGNTGRVVVLDDRGAFLRFIGEPGTPAALVGAAYLRFDKDGNLVVLDMAGTRVVTVNPADGALVRAWGERKAAVDAFIFIGGFDFDAAGNLVVGDRSSSMLRGFLPDGRYLYNVTDEKGEKGADTFTPKGIAIDPTTDTVFVVEGLINRVQAFKMTGPVPPPQTEAAGEAE